MLKALIVPAVLTLVALVGMWVWGGFVAAATTFLLIILEVTLSFDNAIVNAGVLQRMTPVWQKRFLTWGIFSSVVFTRAVLPILIVAAAVGASPWYVGHIALFDPETYAHLLEGAHPAIAAFGGIFLTLVAFAYFIDERKDKHWIHVVEHHIAKWGRIEALEIALALIILLICAFAVPIDERSLVLAGGIVGVALFIIVHGIASALEDSTSRKAAQAAGVSGLGLFIYLDVLDAAFSLDSVVGAFALSTSIPVIVAGLGIGAYTVRSFTLAMVRGHVLDRLVYIEHGAHWAIFGLAIALLAGLFVEVPEPVTGFIGLLFVGLAYWSSVRVRTPKS